LIKDPASRWNPTHLQYIATLQEQLKNLGRVADGITPAKDAPAISQSSSQVNLTELLRRATGGFQQLARQNNVTLSLEINNEAVLVQANPGQIFQVLNGLISNGIKFSNPGGQVTIRMEKTAEPAVHVMIMNSGQAIDPQTINAIFNPNFRPPTTQLHRFGGIGISLSLIKEIISGQKGKIWVESQAGQGTRFHFTLPMIK
jgi:signal transduction histidine kinase